MIVQCLDEKVQLSEAEIKSIRDEYPGSFLNILMNDCSWSKLEEKRERDIININDTAESFKSVVRCYTSGGEYVDVLCEDVKSLRERYEKFAGYYNLLPPRNKHFDSIDQKALNKLIYPLCLTKTCQLGGANAFNLLVGAPLEKDVELAIVNNGLPWDFGCVDILFSKFFCVGDDNISSTVYELLNYEITKEPIYAEQKEKPDMGILSKIAEKNNIYYHEEGTSYYIFVSKEKLDEKKLEGIAFLYDSGINFNLTLIEVDYLSRIMTIDRSRNPFKLQIMTGSFNLFSSAFIKNPFTSVIYYPEYGFTSKYLTQLAARRLKLTPEQFIEYKEYIKKYDKYVRFEIV